MSHVGRTFLFDYGAMAIRVRYLCGVVTQVVDFDGSRVYTTWTAAGGTLAAFQGTVS